MQTTRPQTQAEAKTSQTQKKANTPEEWVSNVLETNNFNSLTLPDFNHIVLLHALEEAREAAIQARKETLAKFSPLKEIPAKIYESLHIPYEQQLLSKELAQINAQLLEEDEADAIKENKQPSKRKKILEGQKNGRIAALEALRTAADKEISELNELIKARHNAVLKVAQLIDIVRSLIFLKLNTLSNHTALAKQTKIPADKIFTDYLQWVKQGRPKLADTKFPVESIPTKIHEFAAFDECGRHAVDCILGMAEAAVLDFSQWTEDSILRVLRNTKEQEATQVWSKLVLIIKHWVLNKNLESAKKVLIAALRDPNIPPGLQTCVVETLIDPNLFTEIAEEKNFSRWLNEIPHDALGNLVVKCLPSTLDRLTPVMVQLQEHILKAPPDWRARFITSFCHKREFNLLLTEFFSMKKLSAFLDKLDLASLSKVLEKLADMKFLSAFLGSIPPETILKFLQNSIDARSNVAVLIFNSLTANHIEKVLLAKEARLFLLNSEFISSLSGQSQFIKDVEATSYQLLLKHVISVITENLTLYTDTDVATLCRFISGESMANLLKVIDDQLAKTEENLQRTGEEWQKLRDSLDSENWKDENKKEALQQANKALEKLDKYLQKAREHKIKFVEMLFPYFMALNDEEQKTFALLRYQNRFGFHKNLLSPFSFEQAETHPHHPLHIMILIKLLDNKGPHQQDENFKKTAVRGIIIYLLKGNLNLISELDANFIKSILKLIQLDELAFLLEQTHLPTPNVKMHQMLIAEIISQPRLIALMTDEQFAALAKQCKTQKIFFDVIQELLTPKRKAPYLKNAAERLIQYISKNNDSLTSGDFYRLAAKYQIALDDKLLERRLDALLSEEAKGQDEDALKEAYDLVRAKGSMPGADIKTLIDFYLRVTKGKEIDLASDEGEFWKKLFAQQFANIIANVASPDWEQINFYVKTFCSGSPEKVKGLLEFLPDNDQVSVLFLRAMEGLINVNILGSIWKETLLNFLELRSIKTISSQIQGGDCSLTTVGEIIKPVQEAVRDALQSLSANEMDKEQKQTPDLSEEKTKTTPSVNLKITAEEKVSLDNVYSSKLKVAEARLRGCKKAIKDERNIKKLIENVGDIREIAVALHNYGWDQKLPIAAVQVMAQELNSDLLFGMCNTTESVEFPIMLKLLHKACGGTELVPFIPDVPGNLRVKYNLEDDTRDFISDDQFKYLIAQFSLKYPNEIHRVLKLFENMADISLTKQKELWVLRRFNKLKSKTNLNAEERGELNAMQTAYKNAKSPAPPAIEIPKQQSDEKEDPGSPRAVVTPPSSPLHGIMAVPPVSSRRVVLPKPAEKKLKGIKLHLPMLHHRVKLEKVKNDPVKYFAPNSSDYLFRQKNCKQFLSAEDITTNTFNIISLLLQNKMSPLRLNLSLETISRLPTPPSLAENSKKPTLSLLFPRHAQLPQSTQIAAVVLGYLQAICAPVNEAHLTHARAASADAGQFALKFIMTDAANFVAFCKDKRPVNEPVMVLFCNACNKDPEIITDKEFQDLLQEKIYKKHWGAIPAVLERLNEHKDKLSPGKKTILAEFEGSYRLSNPVLHSSVSSVAFPSSSETKVVPSEMKHNRDDIDESCAGEILGWRNNCALNCMAHTLLDELQNAELKEPLTNQGYQEFLATFSAYYCINPTSTLAQFRALMSTYPNPVDQELILGPVLRLQLDQLTRGQAAIAAPLLLSDASPLRYGFTQAVERYLLLNGEANYEYAMFHNKNEPAFLEFQADFKKYCATQNVNALNEVQLTNIRTYWKNAGNEIPENRKIPPEECLVALFMQLETTKAAIRKKWETGAYVNYANELNGLNQLITPGDLRPLCERFQFNLAVSRVVTNDKKEMAYNKPVKLIIAPGVARPTVALAYDGRFHFQTLFADPFKAAQHNDQFPYYRGGRYYKKQRKQAPEFFDLLNNMDDFAAQNEIRLHILLRMLVVKQGRTDITQKLHSAAVETLAEINTLRELESSIEADERIGFRQACADKVDELIKAVSHQLLENVIKLKDEVTEQLRVSKAAARRVVI